MDLFASVAAFGVRQIEDFIMGHASVLGAIGGIILIVVGIRTSRAHVDAAALAPGSSGANGGQARLPQNSLDLRADRHRPCHHDGHAGHLRNYGRFLQLTTVPARAGMTVVGVMLGSFLWWCFISGMVGLLRSRINGVWLDRINHWSGILIVAFGFVFLFDALLPLWR